MNMQQINLASSEGVQPEALDEGLDFWSKRYALEGHIWGDESSLTAQMLAEKLAESSDESVKNVLEVGFGYGRDMKELLQNGYRVVGVEVASEGLNMATKELRSYLQSSQAMLVLGEFTNQSLLGKFDAVASHRVLHLLGNNGLVRAFANKAASVLKTDGLLYVSARNEKDFNPEQMTRIGPNEAVYKDRPGHVISFWDNERFKEVFGKKFDIIDFVDATEIESNKNPVDSHFTLMIARKKAEMDYTIS